MNFISRYLILMLALSYIAPRSAVIYGTLILHNKESKKTVILLSDAHINFGLGEVTEEVILAQNETITSAYTKELNSALQQQEEIITCAQKIKNVHLLIEDEPGECFEHLETLSKDQSQDQNFLEGLSKSAELLKALIGPARVGSTITPLALLTNKAKESYINCTNIDIRSYQKKCAWIKKKFSKELQLMRSYCDDTLFNEEVKSNYLDAYALYTILKSPKSVVMLCAGGGHVAIISKMLVSRNYTALGSKIPQELDSYRYDLFYFYKDGEKIKEETCLTQEVVALQDLDNVVLNLLKGKNIIEEQNVWDYKLPTILGVATIGGIILYKILKNVSQEQNNNQDEEQ